MTPDLEPTDRSRIRRLHFGAPHRGATRAARDPAGRDRSGAVLAALSRRRRARRCLDRTAVRRAPLRGRRARRTADPRHSRLPAIRLEHRFDLHGRHACLPKHSPREAVQAAASGRTRAPAPPGSAVPAACRPGECVVRAAEVRARGARQPRESPHPIAATRTPRRPARSRCGRVRRAWAPSSDRADQRGLRTAIELELLVQRRGHRDRDGPAVARLSPDRSPRRSRRSLRGSPELLLLADERAAGCRSPGAACARAWR